LDCVLSWEVACTIFFIVLKRQTTKTDLFYVFMFQCIVLICSWSLYCSEHCSHVFIVLCIALICLLFCVLFSCIHCSVHCLCIFLICFLFCALFSCLYCFVYCSVHCSNMFVVLCIVLLLSFSRTILTILNSITYMSCNTRVCILLEMM